MLLKTVPPKTPAGFLVRPHLALERFRLAGIQVIEVSAPHGFGKTSQLAQWHREATAAGIATMWLSLDGQDEVPRLIHGLTAAAKRLGKRKHFSRDFADWMGSFSDPHQSLTGWLAEVSQLPQDIILILDDIDHLPLQSRMNVIHYILANSANNLGIIFSSRPNSEIITGGVLGSTPMIRLTARELRFGEQETTAVVSQALSDAHSEDLSVRIHALTDGWPLGVRLAVVSQLRNDAGVDWERSVSANLNQYFDEGLLGRLPENMQNMLVRMAHFDPIHPDLCLVALGPDAPVADLDRLADESPIVTKAEDGGWLRLHPIAREILAKRHLSLSESDRRNLAVSAGQWYAHHGLLEEAARQAILADDRNGAIRFAEASLRNMLVQGRLGEVLDWYGRVSGEELDDRPGFWAPAAWALAMSNRPEEARRLVGRIFGRVDASEAARFEANLILATLAGYEDDLAQLEEFAVKWPEPPVLAGAGEVAIHATSHANYALLCGKPGRVRSSWNDATQDRFGNSPIARGFVDLFLGLSYLWEGKPQLAYESLREALARAEERMDRGNRVVSMIAAGLAQACLETGRLDEARLHLALRIPILEKQGLPDSVISAFCTLAELADDEGRQDHAEVQLASLAAIGRSRGIIRMEVAALSGLVRFHTRHERTGSAMQAAEKLDAMNSALGAETKNEIRLWVELHSRLAIAEAHGVSRNRELLLKAASAATRAQDLAKQLNRGADLVRAKFLQSEILTRLGNPRPAEEMDEAASLCRAVGLIRLLESHYPHRSFGAVPETDERQDELSPAQHSIGMDRTFLTPREYEVLLRLVNRMSNKEIALSMGVGEETVKWHLKNLFRKLDAGDRRSVVSRARTLGLA